jgi:uncharacterized protein (TIGR02001 family)
MCSHAEFGGVVLFATDYIQSGYSKSNGNPVVQVNLDYEFLSGIYLGAWLSPVDFNDSEHSDRASVELIPYIGWGQSYSSDWRFDTILYQYAYDDDIFGRNSNYAQIDLQLGFRDIITARFSWSPDYYNRNEAFIEYELSARYPLSDTLEVSGGIGFSQLNTVLEYNYIISNLGASWYYQSYVLDLRLYNAHEVDEVVHDTDHLFAPKEIHTTLAFSLSYSF